MRRVLRELPSTVQVRYEKHRTVCVSFRPWNQVCRVKVNPVSPQPPAETCQAGQPVRAACSSASLGRRARSLDTRLPAHAPKNATHLHSTRQGPIEREGWHESRRRGDVEGDARMRLPSHIIFQTVMASSWLGGRSREEHATRAIAVIAAPWNTPGLDCLRDQLASDFVRPGSDDQKEMTIQLRLCKNVCG